MTFDAEEIIAMSDSATSTSQVAAHLWEYAIGFDSLLRAADSLETHLKHLLDESTIVPLSVTVRAKSLESYQQKSERSKDGFTKYVEPRREITDCIAARIITFSKSDKERVCEVIRDQLCPHEDHDPGEAKQNGYSSQHFLVGEGAWSERLAHISKYYSRHSALEVQVRTVAEHAWAEYEHHVRFKPDGEGAYNSVTPEVKAKIDRLLVQAAGDRDGMNYKFGEIEEILRPATFPPELGAQLSLIGADAAPVGSDVFNAVTFQDWLADRYSTSPESGDKAIDWMIEVLEALGINSAVSLEATIADVDTESVAALIEYRFPPGRIRRLDDDLLAALGEGYISANEVVTSGEPNRQRILSWRWGRLNGKLKIYSFTGQSVSSDLRSKDLSASAAFRECIILLVALAGSLDVALIPEAISPDADLPVSVRATSLSTSQGQLWVHANLTRQLAEGFVVELLGRLPNDSKVEFNRSGEVLWPVLQ